MLNELYDYRRQLSYDDFVAAVFMETVEDAARDVPFEVFMNPDNWDDPVVALAYKLFEDQYTEEG